MVFKMKQWLSGFFILCLFCNLACATVKTDNMTSLLQISYETADKNDAYSLSMPLLASAELGHLLIYRTLLPEMQAALNRLPNDARKAWLLGRVLSAAESVNDKATANKAREQMVVILKKSPHNAFYAWSLGYLAASNKTEYQRFKNAMLTAAGKSNLSATDAMWAWIMALKAAASAKDSVTYHFILKQMKTMTHASSILRALEKGLTKEDYPAWGLAIVRFSAGIIGDIDLYNDLSAPLAKSINLAHQSGATNDAMLAQITAGLPI